MTALNIVLIILCLLIILILLFFIVYKSKIQKLELTKERLNDSESEFLDKYMVKYDLILQLIEYTEKKYKIECKAFKQVKEIDNSSISSFKNEKIINKSYKEITKIREDNPNAREAKSFKEQLLKYNENELSLISLRTYHNKYTLVYNNMIKKFPYNIISKLKKYNISELIEGKELDNNFKNLEV